MDKTAEIPDFDHFFRKTAAKWENVLFDSAVTFDGLIIFPQMITDFPALSRIS